MCVFSTELLFGSRKYSHFFLFSLLRTFKLQFLQLQAGIWSNQVVSLWDGQNKKSIYTQWINNLICTKIKANFVNLIFILFSVQFDRESRRIF